MQNEFVLNGRVAIEVGGGISDDWWRYFLFEWDAWLINLHSPRHNIHYTEQSNNKKTEIKTIIIWVDEQTIQIALIINKNSFCNLECNQPINFHINDSCGIHKNRKWSIRALSIYKL